jgi:hypothetical protein
MGTDSAIVDDRTEDLRGELEERLQLFLKPAPGLL